MSLWGNKDTKAVSGTIDVVQNDVAIVGTNTVFTEELVPGNTLVIDGVEYKVDAIIDDTNLNLHTAYAGSDATGLTVTANEQPAYVLDSDRGNVYGVDQGSPRYEAEVNRDKGINTPGWVKYTTYTDAQGNTRHKAETLVAIKTIQGDAADDSVVQDD